MSTTPNNDARSQGPLRVAVIADPERLPTLLGAVDACVLIQPLGQSGMPSSAGLADVPWHPDPRVLLGQPNLEAVVLAAAPRLELELAGLAVERGLHVWRLPPLARRFAEGTELISRVRQLPTVYRVASWWEYVVDHVWHDVRWPAEFKPLLSELDVHTPGPGPGSWRGRLTEALGGVLAADGYPLLEALVALRGLPETVAAAIGQYRTNAGGTARETEDTALAILTYAGGGSCSIRATWDIPPFHRRLAHHAGALSVTISDEELALQDASGASLERHPLPGDFLTGELLRFAETVRGQARDRAAAPLERHLAVTALLESVYLAARTGHPEAPRKFYEVQGWPEPRA